MEKPQIMRINNNSDLVGYAIAAVIGAVFIYHFHKYLLIALALFGLWYLMSEHNRNNRPPRG